MKRLTLIALFTCLMSIGMAQVETPAASPSSTVEQTVGLTDFTIEYSRPSVKDRVIFGDLVPYDQLWRTGANASTDITFNHDIDFAGTKVPAGTYALYTYPGKSQWRVLLYEDADLWGSPGDDFDPEKVVAQAEVPSKSVNPAVESFTIGFDHLRNDGAHLTLAWDDTMVAVPVKVNTGEKVEKSIEKTFSGPTANDYYAAGSYYYEEGKDLEQAHQWVEKAVSMNPKAFWMMKTKAEIEAKLGMYDQAIQTAEKSMEAAQAAGNMQYVGYNKDNIAEWKKMK